MSPTSIRAEISQNVLYEFCVTLVIKQSTHFMESWDAIDSGNSCRRWVSGDKQVDASSSSRPDEDAHTIELLDSSELQFMVLNWELAQQSSLRFQ